MNVHVPGIDLHMVGWILTLAGVVGLVWTLLVWNRARAAVRTPVVREERVLPDERRGY